MNFDLALITARGGSKGLPRKNVRILAGRPLIAWTIAAALKSELFERVVVSTDSEVIAEAALRAGAEVPFMRPPRLATDEASSADVLRHALSACEVKGNFALLQPTSPFRSACHLHEAAKLYADYSPPAVVGAIAAKPPAWTYMVDERGRMTPALHGAEVSRRQEAGKLVQPNGAIYFTSAMQFARTGSLLPTGTLAYRMDAISSIDIDGPADFELAEAIAASRLESTP